MHTYFHFHKLNEVFIVPDSGSDIRLSESPLNTGEPYIIFYTGFPLVTDSSFSLTLFNVLLIGKQKCRAAKQLPALKMLANHVVIFLELKKQITVYFKKHQ